MLFRSTLLSIGQATSIIATYNSSITLQPDYITLQYGTNVWNFRASSYTETYAPFITFSSYKAIDSSAQLEVSSTTKGFLQPKMTNAQAVAISTPATGLQVYDTTNNKNLLYDSTAWRNIATETWVSAQGYLTSVPTLAQVTTAGNTTTNSITVGGLSATLNVAFYNNLTTSSYFSTNGIHSDGRMALYGTDVNGTIQLLAHRGAFGGGAASLFPGSVSVGGITGAIGYQNNNLAIQSHIIGTGIINSGTHKSLAIGTPNTAVSGGFGGNTDTIDIGTFSSVSNTWGGTRPSITYTALSHIFKVNNGTGQNNPGTNVFRIESTGNVLINTTADAGYTLDVNGTARVQNDFTIGNNRYLKAFRWTNDNTSLPLQIESNSTYTVPGINFISFNNSLVNNTKNLFN